LTYILSIGYNLMYSKQIQGDTMKKTLLLSVVASTMIMAGGTIAPVEPVVEVEAVIVEAPASNWDFSGQAVVYYQTAEAGEGSLFDQENAVAAAGIQLGATTKSLVGPIGAGVELSGLSSVGLEQDVVSGLMQSATGDLTGAAITQAYLTAGFGNTSIKIGRQQLPKSLSPFAFSEGWNVFKNTFEAALVVNSDIPDTTLVYAAVTRSNASTGPLSTFTDINANGDVVHMLTAQNKSIDGLTLTGTYYLAPDFTPADDLSVIWGDAKFNVSDYTVALQGGTVLAEDALGAGSKDTTAFGAKIGANFGMFETSVAYSTVDDGSVPIHNLGTGVKTPLYTQMILNQARIKSDNDTVVLRAGVKALGGKFGVAYDMTTDNSAASNDSTELDVVYTTKVGSVKLLAGYVLVTQDNAEDTNVVRVWGRYNF
jgi:hypothetical protein